MKFTDRTQAALELIQGTLSDDGESVTYYDDASRSHYTGDAADLEHLAGLMESKDPEIAASAYSHWCAWTFHRECDAEGNVLAVV